MLEFLCVNNFRTLLVIVSWIIPVFFIFFVVVFWFKVCPESYEDIILKEKRCNKFPLSYCVKVLYGQGNNFISAAEKFNGYSTEHENRGKYFNIRTFSKYFSIQVTVTKEV